MKANRNLRLWLLSAAICALIAACGRPERGVDLPMPPTSTGKARMHAVRNEQLREVMNGLAGVSFDRLPQELDGPGRQRARLQEASSIAEDLAQAADRIAGVAGESGLAPSEQEVFLSLAALLRDRALRLQSQADRGQTRFISAAMKEINETCVACHKLFRDMPQPSPSGAL